MGYRTHLHICQHCGIVQATASETSPKRCIVCAGVNFSEHYTNELLRTRRGDAKWWRDSEDRFERIPVESAR
ncbi:hypothetical protein [Haloferax sp. DFSO52]|uniref:hypothetical protein n=1 Tax=Haloferax sp. DFSO52 TaxID=3388505 RepID=UPI003A874E6F